MLTAPTSYEAQKCCALPSQEACQKNSLHVHASALPKPSTSPVADRHHGTKKGKTLKTANHLCHLIMLHAHHIFHQVIGLTDQLHVSILNPIVYHLHKMSSSFLSHLSGNIQKSRQQQHHHHFQCLIPARGFLLPKGGNQTQC